MAAACPPPSAPPTPLEPLPSDALSHACRTRDVALVMLAISRGARPDRDTLTVACGTGDARIVEQIVGAGARLNGDALEAARRSGNPEILSLVSLMRMDATPERESELTLACKTKDYPLVLAAIRREVLPDDGTLGWACVSKDPRIVRAVIAAGARPDAYDEAYPDRTVLDHAYRSENLDIVKAVAAIGAKVSPNTLAKAIEITAQTGEVEFINLALRFGAEIQPSTLTTACLTGDSFVARAVYGLGARPDKRTLTAACSTGQLEVVAVAIGAGAKPDSATLTAAITTGNVDLIRAVFRTGARADDGAFVAAARHSHPDILRYAIAAGARADARALAGALQDACCRSAELVTDLLGLGARADQTCLEFAVVSGDPAIVRAILDTGLVPDQAAIDRARQLRSSLGGENRETIYNLLTRRRGDCRVM